MRQVLFILITLCCITPPITAFSPDQTEAVTQVAFLSFAPSPYSNRHDCMRAGFGIYLQLTDLIKQHKLPIKLSYYDAASFVDDGDKIKAVLNSADMYILGGSTWGQGPTTYIRRFFEKGGANNLMGAKASAWATAGGTHTGGELVVQSTLRSMMGLGASVFTLAQKYMVFTTDERVDPKTPGHFSQLDAWYMDQFARMIAVTAATENRQSAMALAKKLGVQPLYFLQTGGNEFPPSGETLDSYNPLLKRLNAASNPNSSEWLGLQPLLSKP